MPLSARGSDANDTQLYDGSDPGNGDHDEHQEQSQSEEVLGLPMFPDLDSLEIPLPGPEQPQIPSPPRGQAAVAGPVAPVTGPDVKVADDGDAGVTPKAKVLPTPCRADSAPRLGTQPPASVAKDSDGSNSVEVRFGKVIHISFEYMLKSIYIYISFPYIPNNSNIYLPDGVLEHVSSTAHARCWRFLMRRTKRRGQIKLILHWSSKCSISCSSVLASLLLGRPNDVQSSGTI